MIFLHTHTEIQIGCFLNYLNKNLICKRKKTSPLNLHPLLILINNSIHAMQVNVNKGKQSEIL